MNHCLTAQYKYSTQSTRRALCTSATMWQHIRACHRGFGDRGRKMKNLHIQIGFQSSGGKVVPLSDGCGTARGNSYARATLECLQLLYCFCTFQSICTSCYVRKCEKFRLCSEEINLAQQHGFFALGPFGLSWAEGVHPLNPHLSNPYFQLHFP